jgi:hypothetical protein
MHGHAAGSRVRQISSKKGLCAETAAPTYKERNLRVHDEPPMSSPGAGEVEFNEGLIAT